MLRYIAGVALFVSASLALTTNEGQCRFAPTFSTKMLLSNASSRDEFMRNVMVWESQFAKVAVNNVTGLTYDGTEIDYTTGEPTSPLHYWTAPSKESIHLMMLAKALDGNAFAQRFVDDGSQRSVEEIVLGHLERKMNTFEKWNREFPGFGGFLPWVDNNASGVVPLPAWENQVPSLDNGEMIWGLYACKVVAFEMQDSRFHAIASRISNYLTLLSQNARIVFYAGDGHIRSVSTIRSATAVPSEANYGMDCDPSTSNCYLDDPYEGELFAVFMDLYSQWPNSTDRESVWIAKRAMLQNVEYLSDDGPITVQRGFWFSAHEQWKYLELPYLTASPINRRVFLNGERARTQDSFKNKIPGLFASVTDVCHSGQQPPDYISAAGIQSIAFEVVTRRDIITPYGAFPTMLADLPTGLAWYHNMLMGTAMQGPLGSTESISTNGTMIAPVVTWDSKITSVVAMVGGVSDIVERGLKKDGTFDRFAYVIDREWSRVFPSLKGENIPFALPSSTIPVDGVPIANFPTCT